MLVSLHFLRIKENHCTHKRYDDFSKLRTWDVVGVLILNKMTPRFSWCLRVDICCSSAGLSFDGSEPAVGWPVSSELAEQMYSSKHAVPCQTDNHPISVRQEPSLAQGDYGKLTLYARVLCAESKKFSWICWPEPILSQSGENLST